MNDTGPVPSILGRPLDLDSARLQALPAAAVATLLGAVVLYGVLLSPLEAAHNAAHDTRHVLVAPCH